jgi:large subunit ribosomal protein L29
MTQAGELRELHDEELENRLAEASQELFNLRFQHVTGQLDNYSRLSEVRREVARVNTLLREREIAAAEAAQGAAAADQPSAEVQEVEKTRRRARVLASRRRAAQVEDTSGAQEADKEPSDG